MESFNINGSNAVNAAFPAGICILTPATIIANAGFVTEGESQADVFTFGAAAAPFNCIFAPPSSFQPDQTAYPIVPPATFNVPEAATSWIKVINNTSGQIVTVKGTNKLTKLPTAAGLAIAAGDVKLVVFDGVNTPYTLT